MKVVKHVTSAETLSVPAGHLAIVVPVTELGEQSKTKKGGKDFRPIETGISPWGSVPCENNAKIRVKLSAIAVDPSQYVEADKKAKTSRTTITL